MVGVDLFAGSGGLSQGASDAGVNVRLAVEVEPNAAFTYRRNHPNTKVLQNDVRRLKAVDVDSGGESTILFGGPPCQGFSISNQRTRTTSNPQNWLFQEFLRLAESWNPDWVLIENVTGIKQTQGAVFLRSILSGLERLGYGITIWNLNAADYGVPQVRSRLFVVGSRRHSMLPGPPPMAKLVTVRDAIGDLPELESGAMDDWKPYRCDPVSEYAERMRERLNYSSDHLVTKNGRTVLQRYKHVPQGGNWENIPSKLMQNYSNRSHCHTRIYYRLKYDAPSTVIGNYRKNMLIHPVQDRGLSVREAARLQSFPDRYQFSGSIGFRQQQVANAVPPLLAKAVFREILRHCAEGHVSLLKGQDDTLGCGHRRWDGCEEAPQ